MNLAESRSEIPFREPVQAFNIDLRRVLFRSLRYWYVFVICLFASLTYSYFKTRYAIRIYPVTTSIIFKEKESNSEGRLLYNNPLVSGFRNYINEIYLIKSYPLIQRTLWELNFGVAFYNEGNVLTTEIYDPQIDASIIKSNGDHRFYFKILNSHQFQLFESKESSNNRTFAFGDTATFNGLTFVFRKKDYSRSVITPDQSVVFTYSNPSYLTGSYVSGLQASWAEERAGVMNLTIYGPNPQKDIDFLNGLIKVYERYDLEKKNQAASRTIDFINNQLTVIKDSLRAAEDNLERFKNDNLLNSVGVDAKGFSAKISIIEEDRAGLLLKASYYKYLEDYIQKDALDKIILPTSIGLSDPILTALVAKLIDLQSSIKTYDNLENPLVASAKEKIHELKINILESISNLKSADKIKDDFIGREVTKVENKMKGLPLAERKLVSIERNYSLLENLYVFLLQKMEEASISRASNTTDISILNPPMQSGGAISPKPTQNYLIAILIGLGFPSIIFVLLELFNSKVQSKEDVEKISSIPFIGGIGHKKGENNLEVFASPKNSIAESFRALRSDLNYFLGKKENAVILITSSISGEGKTFTSINLASVISLAGKKTLIVGADMRKPKLFTDFRLTNDVGLSSYLSGICEYDSIVQKTPYPGLDLVSGGPVPPNPSELLLNDRMSDFIQESKRRYDFIIIDTPPLAIVSDAFSFSKYADHTLFVIRQSYTPIALLRTLEDSYRAGKFKNLSIVLNDIYVSGPGYGYGYGYGYGDYGSSKKKRNGYGYYS